MGNCDRYDLSRCWFEKFAEFGEAAVRTGIFAGAAGSSGRGQGGIRTNERTGARQRDRGGGSGARKLFRGRSSGSSARRPQSCAGRKSKLYCAGGVGRCAAALRSGSRAAGVRGGGGRAAASDRGKTDLRERANCAGDAVRGGQASRGGDRALGKSARFGSA